MPSFQQYCWSMGTTSFRTKKFNYTIERQLELLNAFREEHSEQWSNNESLQEQYYDFLVEKEFVEGCAPRKAKDARQKTSGLVDIGLIDEERRITEAGESLLKVFKTDIKKSDNILQISNDSYFYLKQLLKASVLNVRPFVVLTLSLLKLGHLSKDEFTYLLPLICSEKDYGFIISQIERIRKNEITINDVIICRLFQMKNYQDALHLFTSTEKVTEKLICNIGMNRKSRAYDKSYFVLYNLLHKYVFEKDETIILELFNSIKKNRIGTYWRTLLFKTNSLQKIKREKSAVLTNSKLLSAKSETEFRELFFKAMHLFKAKATLADYYDLNKRYFGLSDIILFQYNEVRLDVIPSCFFALCTSLKSIAFEKTEQLCNSLEIDEIIPDFLITEEILFEKLKLEYGIQLGTDVKTYINDERHQRLNKMIDEKFPKKVLIELLDDFENRNDDRIQELVTDNADVPTIFEYIVGIIWYEISDRKGNILDFMNLSLDADLLPKTHAAGGGEDITYKYDGTYFYPKHSVLIELTLADGTNMRRMEMEPVSRHLGDYLLSNNSPDSYAVFVSPYLHPNVISDFRSRKYTPYYSNDFSKEVTGMKIIPLKTSELKSYLQADTSYNQLYSIFENAFNATESPKEWYQRNIAAESPMEYGM